MKGDFTDNDGWEFQNTAWHTSKFDEGKEGDNFGVYKQGGKLRVK
jgi:hypothetical protein